MLSRCGGVLDTDLACVEGRPRYRCRWVLHIRENVCGPVHGGRNAQRVGLRPCWMYSADADAGVYDRLKCDEAQDEPPTVSVERVLKIECNISGTTNFMHTGIMDVRAATFPWSRPLTVI